MTKQRQASVVIRENPLVASMVCAISVVVILFVVGMKIFQHYKPPKEALPDPIYGWLMLAAAVVALVVGLIMVLTTKVLLRIEPSKLVIPKFKIAIPWQEIAAVDIVRFEKRKNAQAAMPTGYLVIALTPAGCALINRTLSDVTLPKALSPRPDICLKFNVMSYGPGIDGEQGFIKDLLKRVAVASGRAELADFPDAPSDRAGLQRRDTSETGESSRVYVCDCGGGTAISDTSLMAISNPFRYASGTMCASCGVTYFERVYWADTGESVARFRKRMWKLTPLWIKLLQLLLIPCIVGVLCGFFFPLHKNFTRESAFLGLMALGFVVGTLLNIMTPLGELIPAVTGMKYRLYR